MSSAANNSSRNSTTHLTQEYFDEAVLENQEAFNLSPEEAVKEAIDQILLQQIDAEHLERRQDDVAANSATLAKSIPSSLLHLSLTHPDSSRGKLDRKNRNDFQNNLNVLDGCIKGDGSLISFADDDDARFLGNSSKSPTSSGKGERTAITKQQVVKALKLVARRCQFGDDSNNCIERDENSKSTLIEPACIQKNSTTEKSTGPPLPYLTIFQQTSSIYTLMSFLSVVDPTLASTRETGAFANGNEDGNATKTCEVILLETVKALSAILSSPIRNGSTAETDITNIMLRAKLRDSFIPAMTRVVKLTAMYACITYNIHNQLSLSQKAQKNEEESQTQIAIFISLLRLGLHATRGCEGAKVAFVQSAIPCSLLAPRENGSNNGTKAEGEDEAVSMVRRGGVKALVYCLSSFGNANSCSAPSTVSASNESATVKTPSCTMTTVEVLAETCQLLASLCRYDDFRDPSSSQQSNPMAGSVGNVSSAHDHAMEFYRAGVLPPLMKVAKGVLIMLENHSADDDGLNLDIENEKSYQVITTSTPEIVPEVFKNAAIDERLAASCLTALRVLAVNDEIVQTMVALGVLPTVTKALELSVRLDESKTNDDIGENTIKHDQKSMNVACDIKFNGRKQRLAAASLGLVRNLCGNDEIKTNLCLGSSSTSVGSSTSFAAFSTLPYIFQAMKNYSETAIIQEHACGTLAAMALRRPANARAIIDGDGPRLILTAMKRHETNVNVQRQGALAVRNIVSRLLMGVHDSVNDSNLNVATDGTDIGGEVASIRELFLEWGAEDVLRNIAGRNQGSVDEAYAALRDLGCPVSLVKFDTQDFQRQGNGHFNSNVSMGVARTMMFGEQHNSNFRPVFEASEGLEDGVEDAVAQFGA
ncbi:hypothetical protein ACHAXS_005253 [Conticribra weissflogii]